MTCAVLSIGTELTRGELVNTNASWLSNGLTELGFEVTEHCVVDDQEARIVAALDRLARGAKVVVCTGGLGPTTDDLTTAAAASALGVGLQRDEASLDHIRRRIEKLGRPMNPSNAKQADFPEGATILANPIGTAPGFEIALHGARVFFMPGVPREMKLMFEEQIVPKIRELAPNDSHQIHFRTFGLPESAVGEKLDGVEAAFQGVTIGYRAHFPEIEVKVLARAADATSAEALAARGADQVRERLGDIVYGDREDSYAAYVGRVLRERELHLALAESCTGGLVGEMITAVPGSSDYLLLDAVCYSNASKSKLLSVNSETLRAHGAVSSEVAAAMAEGALRISEADLAVSVTGIAGPGGGTEEKPVGTIWFGVARKGAPTVTVTRKLSGDRERIRTLAAYIALHLVVRAAKNEELP